MMKQQGFTLIELVMTIVILGVLAATAMPKFFNLKGDAQAAALAGVGGAIKSALVVNSAVSALNPASAVSTIASTNGDHGCTIVFGRLLEGGLAADFVVGTNAANFSTGTIPPNNPGTTRNCLLSPDGVVSMVITIVN